MLVSPAVHLGEYRKEPRRQVARESKVLKEMKMQEPWTISGKKEE